MYIHTYVCMLSLYIYIYIYIYREREREREREWFSGIAFCNCGAGKSEMCRAGWQAGNSHESWHWTHKSGCHEAAGWKLVLGFCTSVLPPGSCWSTWRMGSYQGSVLVPTAPSSGCSQVSPGELKPMSLSPWVTSIPPTTSTLFVSPLGDDRGGRGKW